MDLTCKQKNRLIEIKVENLAIEIGDEYVDILFDNAKVIENGEIVKDFGETFTGVPYTEVSAVESVVAEYLNGNASIDWIEIPEVLREAKSKFFKPTGIVIGGRDIPKQVLEGSVHRIIPLQIASEKTLAYSDGDYFIIQDAQGSTLTNIEAFHDTALHQMYLTHENIIYGAEIFAQIVKDYGWDEEDK